ncbi:hypothetical protein VB005_03163 [Metarhizium brunneum]
MKATATFFAFLFGLATARPQALQAPENNKVLSKADFVQKFKDRYVDCSIRWISQGHSSGGSLVSPTGERQEFSNKGHQESSSELTCSIYETKGDGPVNLDITCEYQEGGCDFCVNKGKRRIEDQEIENWICKPYETRMGTEAPGEDKHTPTKEFIMGQEADKVPNKADKIKGPEFITKRNLVDATGRIIRPAQEADKVPNKANKLIGPFWNIKGNIVDGTGRIVYPAQGNLVDATRRISRQARKADKVPNRADKLIGPFWNNGDNIVDATGRIV